MEILHFLLQPLPFVTFFVFILTIVLALAGYGLRYLANVDVSPQNVTMYEMLGDQRVFANILLNAAIVLMFILGVLLFVDVTNDVFGERWMAFIAGAMGVLCIGATIAIIGANLVDHIVGTHRKPEDDNHTSTPTLA